MTNGTRRGWGVSVTPRPLFNSGKDPVPIVQEAGWAPGPVWTGAENLALAGIRSPDRPARSQSLYRLSYPAHAHTCTRSLITNEQLVIFPKHDKKSNVSYFCSSYQQDIKMITLCSRKITSVVIEVFLSVTVVCLDKIMWVVCNWPAVPPPPPR